MSLYGQSTQFRYRVRVSKNHIVLQTKKGGITEKVPIKKGDIVTIENKVKVGEDSVTIKRETTYEKDGEITVTKDTSTRRIISGKATVSVDKHSGHSSGE
jgi:hypothetical protein